MTKIAFELSLHKAPLSNMAESGNLSDDEIDRIKKENARAKQKELEEYLNPDSDRSTPANRGPLPEQSHVSTRGNHGQSQPNQQQQQQPRAHRHQQLQQFSQAIEQLPNRLQARHDQIKESPKTIPEIESPLAGIEWEYVDEPDESLACEICVTLTEDPRLLSCCGEHNVCSRCMDRATVLNKGCPFCRAENFKLIPNNALKTTIENLRVWCPKKEFGCDWSGRKNQAMEHLNMCQFAMIMCPQGCGMKFMRHELDKHKLACTNLPVSCRFATLGCKEKFPQKDALQHSEDNVHNHLLQIAKRNEAIRRAALSSSQEVAKSAQKSLAEKSSKLEGLKKQLASSQQSIRSLEQKTDMAKQKLHAIRDEHHTKGVHYTAQLQAKGKEVLQLLTTSRGIEGIVEKLPIPPVEGYTAIPIIFTIDNFASKKQNDEVWVSPPFYTHVAGYKMRMEVYLNGYGIGKGTHISVFLSMMQGENDNYLPWPFQGAVITILFLNQRGIVKNKMFESFGHAAAYLTIQDTSLEFCARVTNGTHGPGRGFIKLVPNSQIGRYVVNDTLRVKLHKIDFLPL